jgi:hypothetical protein
VDQKTGVTPTDAPAQAQDDSQPPADRLALPQQSGFGARGRARRRARFLRRARELAYRDLGGLVYNLHRFGQRNDALVLAKLTTVGQIDGELRTLEGALGEREPVTVLREAGINACPRCAAIHSSEDRFCPNCGLTMSRHADLPIAGPATAQPPLAPTTPVPAAQPAPAAAQPPAAQPPATAQPEPATTEPTPPSQQPAPSSGRSPMPPKGPAATVPVETPPQPPTPSVPTPAQPTGSHTDQPTEIIRPASPQP